MTKKTKNTKRKQKGKGQAEERVIKKYQNGMDQDLRIG